MGKPAIDTPANRTLAGTATFVSQIPTEETVQAEPIRVRYRWGRHGWEYLNTLAVRSIAYGIDGTDDTMIVGWSPDSARLAGGFSGADAEHYPHVIAKLNPGRLMQAYVMHGADDEHLLFEGYPLPKTIQWDGDQQGLEVECLSAGQLRLRRGRAQQILGRLMRPDPRTEWDENDDPERLTEVTTLAPIFNAGGRPNRKATPVQCAGRDGDTYLLYLFTQDDAPGAEYWNYADALRYLVFFYCHRWAADNPVDVSEFLTDTNGVDFIGASHAATSRDPLLRDLTRRCDDEVSVQSCNLDQAMAIVCDRAGVHYHITISGTEETKGGYVATYRLRVFGHLAELNADPGPDTRLEVPPARHDLPRDPPFTNYTGVSKEQRYRRNAANAVMLTLDEDVVTRPVFLGGHREYEATLLLRPGWLPLANLDNVAEADVDDAIEVWRGQFDPEYDEDDEKRTPMSIYHTEHPDHAPVADVFRLWIFPDSIGIDAAALGRNEYWVWQSLRYEPYTPEGEALWYTDPLYGAGLPQSIVGGWVPRWRPFRNTIGRASFSTTDTTPIVRIHFGNGVPFPPPEVDDPGWRVYAGQVQFDAQRAAIRLTEANLWNGQPFRVDPDDADGENAISQYIRRDFWVSITACVQGDERLRYEPQPAVGPYSSLYRTETFDYGFTRFQYRARRSGNSHLNAFPPADEQDNQVWDDDAYESRDDTAALKAFADRQARDLVIPLAAGNVNIPWLSTDYKPGDVITGCYGMRILLDRFPIIKRVAWTVVEGDVQTTLSLTDLRESPEVKQ